MAKVKIATVKQTGFGCPTVYRGLVTVDGRNRTFEAHYRHGGLSVHVEQAEVDVDDRAVTTASDGVCSWDAIKDTVLAGLKAHFA